MTTLKFVDTHNMVAFLSKPTESEGFEQIVDFLNAHLIRTLRLADAEGIDCFSNSTIFENLALMGPKTTAWNGFSSTMASAIICLATNQKFNFSKLMFDNMIRNLDNLSGKILMYPRELTRLDTKIPQSSGPTEHVADEAVHKERGDSLVRAAVTPPKMCRSRNVSGGVTS
ncbi:hypothetical protein Tco_1309132 [Tanacetum coccineum]